MSQFVLTQSKANNQYYFKLEAANNELILSSEGYTTKANCTNGIESVQLNSQNSDSFEKKMSTSGKFYFVLKATANGEIIGTSKMYGGSSSRDGGIASVKKNAPDASISDTTA
ncbi:hypothetical protein SAMN05518672_11490 [Chitinophaga sp. CF118]|uniref:YegP family protein n=1 Tax=Chitinophaga sp. CF118 TaxID=1884367 RepID=UPI0008ED0072|nr:YegP family protein [Chitinophaga sp. CF118]SFF02309.1 hypothetical protein SAMN05518672_11490 [Chitinophaga sp. CF118]